MHYSAFVAASEILIRLGARIRELRRERGWSRRELGERCAVSERFLAEMEAGRGNPSVMSLEGVAHALGTTASALLVARPEVVALLGLRGAGKSTIGRALARRWHLSFVELDARVEEAAGLSLRELFELHGEAYYRQIERESLTSFFATAPRVVLATGGGIVTDRTTFDMLRQNSTTIWLRARPEVHWSRVVAQGDHRPMANDPLAMERLKDLLSERQSLYGLADHVIDVSDLDVPATVREIERLVGRRGNHRSSEERGRV
jgi:XRE family aerobic/anaerobic benzoate catabolism transcriptional regulator